MTIFGNFKAFKWMKSIEKDVELIWGYLYPFCSTFFTFCSTFISKLKLELELENDVELIASKRLWQINRKTLKKLKKGDVELFWGYLYPYCSTFFTFFTLLFSIFNFIFREREKHVSPRRVFLLDQPILLPWYLAQFLLPYHLDLGFGVMIM